MGSGFEAPAVRTAIIRVVWGLEDFITNDGVPYTELEIETIADRSVKSYIGLLDAEV